MEDLYIWLSISLFCNRNNWNILLKDGIVPFVNKIKIHQLLHSYQLAFSYYDGENIRLKLRCLDINKHILALQTDRYFKAYFVNSAIPVNQLKLPTEGVFLSYPENTIQYGLYPIEDDINNNKIADIISSLILQALINDTINEDTLITFSFYLLTALLIVQGNINDQIIENLTVTLNNDLILEKYNEARCVLIEIYIDIKNKHNLPDWLHFWINFCKNDTEIVTIHDPLVLYRKVSSSLFSLLCFTHDMKTLVNYFVKRTVEDQAWVID